MKLIGYTTSYNSACLCTPIYVHRDRNYYHVTNEKSIIESFELCSKPLGIHQLSDYDHSYKIGEPAALVYCKEDKTILAGAADLIVYDIWNHIVSNGLQQEKPEIFKIGFSMNIYLDEEMYSARISTKIDHTYENSLQATAFDHNDGILKNQNERSILGIADEGQKLSNTSNVLSALTHPLRIKIIDYIDLMNGTNTLNILRNIKVGKSTLINHLSILMESGLILHATENSDDSYAVNHRLIAKISSCASTFKSCFVSHS